MPKFPRPSLVPGPHPPKLPARLTGEESARLGNIALRKENLRLMAEGVDRDHKILNLEIARKYAPGGELIDISLDAAGVGSVVLHVEAPKPA